VELEQIIDFAKGTSRMIVREGEEHIPIIIARTPQGLMPIALAKLNKDRFKEAVAKLLHLLQADAYVFVCEAWSAEGEAVAKKVLEQGMAVSELPLDDRTEIVSIMAVERGKSPTGCFAKIKTTPQGRELGDWQIIDGVAEGRMVLTEW